MPKTAKAREESINRFKGHFLAIKVKLNNMRHNMDISRLPNPTKRITLDWEHYQKEYGMLMGMLQRGL